MLAKHNIKSVAIPSRKIASYLPPVKDAIGLKTPGIYRIPASVERSTLDRVVGPSTYALRGMIDTQDWPKQTNPQWQSTVSTKTTSSDYKTPNFSPQKQDTEIVSSGRRLK